jgi:arylsulfatase A-like enzyme
MPSGATRGQRQFALIFALVVLGLAGAIWIARSGTHPVSLILISIDTLRADRVGCYGYARGTSPAIDSLAARGALFQNVVAECSWTLPSHVTMLSGVPPSTHGANGPQSAPGPETRLLAEILREAGYRTIALTDGGYLSAANGLARGFEVFIQRRRGLPKILRDAREHLGRLRPDEPYFLFLHTYDVHCPYTPSEPYASQFASTDAESIETEDRCGDSHFNAMTLSEGQVRYLSDRYDASIREADAHLGEFFAFLDSTGRLDNTVLVVTSDHGEEFWEHGRIGHKGTLYREVLMVPLVVSGPDVRPARVDAQVGLVDLAPTLLDLLGLPIPEDVEGSSLVPLMKGSGQGRGRPAGVAQEARVSEIDWPIALRSVTTPDRHLIVDRAGGKSELYAPRDDPAEGHDLAAASPTDVATLSAILDDYARTHRPRAAEAAEPLTAEQVEELQNLGYVK